MITIFYTLLLQQKELEKLHEKLETETIDASVLRHKLQFYPGEIKNEIQGSVVWLM